MQIMINKLAKADSVQCCGRALKQLTRTQTSAVQSTPTTLDTMQSKRCDPHPVTTSLTNHNNLLLRLFKLT